MRIVIFYQCRRFGKKPYETVPRHQCKTATWSVVTAAVKIMTPVMNLSFVFLFLRSLARNFIIFHTLPSRDSIQGDLPCHVHILNPKSIPH